MPASTCLPSGAEANVCIAGCAHARANIQSLICVSSPDVCRCLRVFAAIAYVVAHRSIRHSESPENDAIAVMAI